MGYWDKRIQGASDVLYSKTEMQIRKHLRQEYLSVYKTTRLEIEALLNDITTPNDLYKLDRYYEIKNNLALRLTKLGMTEQELFGESFADMYVKEQSILDALFQDSGLSRKDTTLLNGDALIKRTIESVWCADGKSWSDRVWTNTEALLYRIEKGIENAILRGASKDEIVRDLRNNFNVGFNQADRIARTELSHVLNAAAEDRYSQAGVEQITVLTSDDERTCEHCSALAGKRFKIGTQILPHHPGCRCTVIPVFD